ncbi:MAG TPA: stage II sporulation protein M [Frankiaceae bacterium]
MELDTFVAQHAGEWSRLEQLTRRGSRPGRLTGEEADELVVLYQRTATHLSLLSSAAPDPQLVGRLSALVARARGVVAGPASPGWRSVQRFLVEVLPAAFYRAGRWSLVTALASVAVATVLGAWVAGDRRVRDQLLPPQDAGTLVNHDFKSYYSDHAAQSFAAHVWTNNALLTAAALVTGVLVLPVLYMLLSNVVNLGISGGFLVAAGRGGEFFGLILPHGILELTAVFVGCAAGLRLGWSWIAPGRRTRSRALAEEGRTTLTLAVGLTGVLAISGVLEAFVTPSGLPTWARIGVGVLAELAFLAYVVVLGRRALALEEPGGPLAGDVTELLADLAPQA